MRIAGESDDAFRDRAERAARIAKVLVEASLANRCVQDYIADPALPAVDTGVLTWSTNLGSLGALTLSLSHVDAPVRSTTVFAALSIPLGKGGMVASATAARDVSGGVSRAHARPAS